MAGAGLSIQQPIKLENIEDYDMPTRIKQESFISENINYTNPMNVEYALDLKSPEFDLANIATECSIKNEQCEISNNSKLEEIPPKATWKPRIIKEEINDTQPENIDPTDITYNFLNKEISKISKLEEIPPRTLKTWKPRIIKEEINDTEPENIDPTDFINNILNGDISDNSKLEDITLYTSTAKVKIGIENMEPRIIKEERSDTEQENFDSTDFKINILNKEILRNNLKNGETELMHMKNLKTESNMMIKEEKMNLNAVNSFSEELSSDSIQNQNVKFNLLSKHHGNNSVNIHLNSKSKSAVNKKAKAKKLMNKQLDSKLTKVSAIKPRTESGMYECPYCGYKCKYDAIFQDHLLSHISTSNLYSCRICNFEGKSKQNYELHMKDGHEDSKMLKCVSCDYKNTCTIQFRSHLSEKGHKVKCPKCDLEFDNSNILKRHLIEHETKVYECSVCKRLMKYKNLKSHLLTHTRAFECKVCGYKTSHGKRLKDHMLVHTKEKPYECEVCKRSFRLELGLKNHMLSHQNRETRKLFECGVCKKNYLSHQALKHHFKRKNHGTIGLPLEIEGVFVKRAKMNDVMNDNVMVKPENSDVMIDNVMVKPENTDVINDNVMVKPENTDFMNDNVMVNPENANVKNDNLRVKQENT